nr:unnamed protein product [Digitaria exilis]
MAKITVATMAIVVLLAVAATASLTGALGDANFLRNAQCVAVVGTDQRSSNATTARELASIALDIAGAEAKVSSGYLSGEAEKRDRTDAGEALSDCTAREDFDGGGFDEAERETGEAEAAADGCEQAFTDRRLDVSIVPGVDNKRMKDKASVASDLIDLKHHKLVSGLARSRLRHRPPALCAAC